MSAVSVSGMANVVRSRTGTYAPPSSRRLPSATSIRTVSTAYSGTPPARPTIARVAESGRPGTSPARSPPICSSASGSRWIDMKLRLPAPQSARLSSNSGRAQRHDVERRAPSPLEQVVDEIEQARVCVVEVLEDDGNCALRRRSARRTSARRRTIARPPRPPRPPAAPAAQARSRRAPPRRLTCTVTASATSARVVASSSVSSSAQRARTISPNAQKLMPSPYAGERPACQYMVSARPSTYFRNSHARRLLPMPAGPISDTNLGCFSRPVAWKHVLQQPQLVGAAHERCLEPFTPVAAAALGHDAHRAPGAQRAVLSLERHLASGLESDGGAGRSLRRLAHEHRPGRCGRLQPARRVNQIARDHALVCGPNGGGRLARQHSRARLDRWAECRARRRPGRDRREPRALDRPRAPSERPTRPSQRRR